MKIQSDQGAITFEILVVPRASRARVGPLVGDRIKISVTAPPVDDRANKAVIELLARSLKVRKQDVEIVSGVRGKRKTVRVVGATSRALAEVLDEHS